MQIRLPLRLSLLLSLIFCLCCYIGAALLTPKIESLLPPERFPTFDRVDKPASPQDLFSDIATDVVPEVEKFFYDSNQEAILKRVGTNVLPQTSNSTCVDTIHSWLMTKLNTSLANTFNNYGDIQTDPSLVQRALVLTTLDKNSLVKSVLSDYLRGHVSVYQMINKTRECVGQNRYIAAWACDLIDDERLQLSFFDNLQETWRLNFHLWVLIEVINAKCLEDSRFWYEIMEHYVKITWAAVLESLESPPRPARVDENLEFVLQKVNSIFFLMKTQLAIRDHRYRPQVFLKMLWLNILEAAHVDKEAGVFDDNTMTALLLNYNANDHYVFLNQKLDALFFFFTAGRSQAHTLRREFMLRNFNEEIKLWSALPDSNSCSLSIFCFLKNVGDNAAKRRWIIARQTYTDWKTFDSCGEFDIRHSIFDIRYPIFDVRYPIFPYSIFDIRFSIPHTRYPHVKSDIPYSMQARQKIQQLRTA
ncbi:hypothetical protein AAMO2058_000477400 [Amorphochlora amoebiformis]